MEPVLISALEHWSFCPRQCGLIHVESVWDENVFTLRGKAAHERADEPTVRQERGKRVERALPIWSDRYGLNGRADVVEFEDDGTPIPVEYKSGPETRHRHAEIQLCAQAMCLEEMFKRAVSVGALYFVSSRKRIAISIDAELRAETIRAIEFVRAMVDSGHVPPVKFGKLCRQCSLLDACLPHMLGVATSSPHQKWAKPTAERDLP